MAFILYFRASCRLVSPAVDEPYAIRPLRMSKTVIKSMLALLRVIAPNRCRANPTSPLSAFGPAQPFSAVFVLTTVVLKLDLCPSPMFRTSARLTNRLMTAVSPQNRLSAVSRQLSTSTMASGPGKIRQSRLYSTRQKTDSWQPIPRYCK